MVAKKPAPKKSPKPASGKSRGNKGK